MVGRAVATMVWSRAARNIASRIPRMIERMVAWSSGAGEAATGESAVIGASDGRRRGGRAAPLEGEGGGVPARSKGGGAGLAHPAAGGGGAHGEALGPHP